MAAPRDASAARWWRRRVAADAVTGSFCLGAAHGAALAGLLAARERAAATPR